MQQDQYKLLFISSVGGVLEFYDFIIYALFASYIAKEFFVTSNPMTGLMISFSTFAIGYLVRPFGGIVFGHFGDRIGRKTTFTISIFMMAFATLGIGLVPSYASIGILAPILVISLRIMQGISLGGEIPGALTYVSEFLSHKRGLACGIVFSALIMGIAFGSLIQTIVVSIFSAREMQAYGWRIPFILGGVIGLVSCIFRQQLRESPNFLALEKNHIEKFPIVTVLKRHSLRFFLGALIISLPAAIITSLFLFTPAYFEQILHWPYNSFLWQRTAAITVAAFLCIVFGLIVDKFHIKKLLIILCFFTGLLVYPIFIIYVWKPEFYLFSFIISAILVGFSAGIVPCVLSELFPTAIRYSGIAASYNAGFALFGGLTPFISLSLIYYTGWLTAPALYLILVSILAIFASIYITASHVHTMKI
jgi:MFS family permease